MFVRCLFGAPRAVLRAEAGSRTVQPGQWNQDQILLPAFPPPGAPSWDRGQAQCVRCGACPEPWRGRAASPSASGARPWALPASRLRLQGPSLPGGQLEKGVQGWGATGKTLAGWSRWGCRLWGLGLVQWLEGSADQWVMAGGTLWASCVVPHHAGGETEARDMPKVS